MLLRRRARKCTQCATLYGVTEQYSKNNKKKIQKHVHATTPTSHNINYSERTARIESYFKLRYRALVSRFDRRSNKTLERTSYAIYALSARAPALVCAL